MWFENETIKSQSQPSSQLKMETSLHPEIKGLQADNPSKVELPLRLKIDRELDPDALGIVIQNTEKLSLQISQSLQPADVARFQSILKESLPTEIYESLKNLNAQDIAIIMATIVWSAALIATGIGIVPVVTGLSVRFWLSELITRAMIAWLSRPKTLSALMGLMPGMKMLAPNTTIALAANFGKDLLNMLSTTLLPFTQSAMNRAKQ